MARATVGIEVQRAWSRRELEALAARLRAHLCPGLGALDDFPVRRILEGARVPSGGRLVSVFGYEAPSLPSSVWAMTHMEDDEAIVSLAPDTWQRLQLDEGRARFSACHELGHVVLHGAELLEHGVLAHAIDEGRPPENFATSSEWQANTFARFLLVPREGLFLLEADGRLDVPTVRDTFRVSKDAAAVAVKAYRG